MSFIIASRRMNYLHEVLTREDKELVKRVFLAQEANSSQGDFFNLSKVILPDVTQNWTNP